MTSRDKKDAASKTCKEEKNRHTMSTHERTFSSHTCSKAAALDQRGIRQKADSHLCMNKQSGQLGDIFKRLDEFTSCNLQRTFPNYSVRENKVSHEKGRHCRGHFLVLLDVNYSLLGTQTSAFSQSLLSINQMRRSYREI